MPPVTPRATWVLQRAPALLALALLFAEAVLFLRVGALREYWASTPAAMLPALLAAPSFVLPRKWWPLGFAAGLLALAPAVLGLGYALYVNDAIPEAQRAFRAAPARCEVGHRTPGCAYDICPPEARYAIGIDCRAGPTGPTVVVYGPSFDVEWVIDGAGRPRRPQRDDAR